MQDIIFDNAEPGMMDAATSASSGLQFGINMVAIIIAVFAVIMAVRLVSKSGGRINRAIRYFILGVACNALAIGWSLFLGHVYLFGNVCFDIHQNFMSLGMLFFIISTFKFSRLTQNV